MCSPADFLKLGSANRINERCLELQKNKKSSKTKVRLSRFILGIADSGGYAVKWNPNDHLSPLPYSIDPILPCIAGDFELTVTPATIVGEAEAIAIQSMCISVIWMIHVVSWHTYR